MNLVNACIILNKQNLSTKKPSGVVVVFTICKSYARAITDTFFSLKNGLALDSSRRLHWSCYLYCTVHVRRAGAPRLCCKSNPSPLMMPADIALARVSTLPYCE